MSFSDPNMVEAGSNGQVTHLRFPRSSTQVRVAQGVSIICCDGTAEDFNVSAALELLRGFRVTGRRVVLCDTSRLPAGRQLGQAIVAEGSGTILVSYGTGGRDVAIGARDSGLDLGSVVVCSDSHSACELVTRQLLPGDTVLLLGAEQRTCDQVVALLDEKAARTRILAA